MNVVINELILPLHFFKIKSVMFTGQRRNVSNRKVVYQESGWEKVQLFCRDSEN